VTQPVVPFFDLEAQYGELRDEILGAIDRVARDAQFVLGDEVALFEQEFADFCGVTHCVAVNSGTGALLLALLAGGVGPGDEVITSANTFTATAEAISHTGATPVFADVRPETGNIDPDGVERTLTLRTRAVIPVHLYGRPADMDPILELARRHNLLVVEDACQAHGARYRGRRVGGIGDAAAFSFYPSKNLGAYGDAGALTTNDAVIAATARSLRNHGQGLSYVHERIGFNDRMDGFQAAVLRIKLQHLQRWTARREELALRYRRSLQGSGLEMLYDDPRDEPVYHLFVVLAHDRDAVRAQLAERGVETRVHYPLPVHRQPAYAHLGYGPGSLRVAEALCARVISLPLYPEMTDAAAESVTQALLEVTRAPLAP
jgi:dTDP-4-amino-4,6-dideoxygalactose transaminase